MVLLTKIAFEFAKLQLFVPQAVQTWMDEATSGFIYFTFGSMMKIESFPKHILDAFYETFRNIAPVRVLLKIAKDEELPPGLPSNVMTQPWFSQVRVLSKFYYLYIVKLFFLNFMLFRAQKHQDVRDPWWNALHHGGDLS